MSEQIGEFTLKHSGCTFGTNSEGEMIANNNFVGEATGFGPVWGTLITTESLSEMNASSGSCQWVGVAFLDDGSELGGIGNGTWEKSSGSHKWDIVMNVNLSDGGKHRAGGSLDLETLIYSGKIYQG